MSGEPTATGRCSWQDTATSSQSVDPVLQGPFPRPWFSVAAQLPGKALHLALMIWCTAGICGSRRVAISNLHALGFGIERNAKYRALAWLEEAGLIVVERRVGRSPIVTILDVGGVKNALISD